MSTLKGDLKAAITVGYLGGLLLAGFEGLHALISTHIGPSSKTIRSAQDLAAILGAPVAAYPVISALSACLLILIVHPLWKRRADTENRDTRVSQIIGLIAVFGLMIWSIFTTNPSLNKMVIRSAVRLLVNAQMIAIAALAGLGIAWLCQRLFLRFSVRSVALTIAAIWPAVIASSLTLLWVKRNLTFWRSTLAGIAAGAGLVLLLFALVVISRVLLNRLYKSGGNLVRSLIVPVVLFVLSICSVVYCLTPRVPTLHGGENGAGRKIILFTIDTLRSDRLGCYGYQRDTSPIMDAMAREGVRFVRARTQSPWTLSSLASIMTSTYPTVCSVMTGNNRLDEARTTIAESMRDAGLLTHAIVSNGWLQDTFGLSQGFIGFHHSSDVFNWTRYGRMIWLRIAKRFFPGLFPVGQNFLATDLVDRANEWLQEYGDRDFFLWIHAIDPHDPYLTPDGYEDVFEDSTYKGRFKRMSGLLYTLRYGTRLRPEDKAQLENLYDREVRYTDDHLGRLVQTLRDLGIYDETLLIVSSDHGEEFWEHDGLMHGHSLYEDQLLVPLIMRYPSRLPKGLAIEEPVRLLDLMPTLLDLFDLRFPDEVQGRSLLPLLFGRPSSWMEEPAYAEALLYFDELKSVSRNGYKLILNPSNDKTMLFDINADPLERWDLAQAEPELLKRLEEDLRGWMRRSEQTAENLPKSIGGSKARIDPETEAQLRALGYLH